MIIFNQNDLKSFIKNKTGYEVSAIYSIDNILVDNHSMKIYDNDKSNTMSVVAYCDVSKTPKFNYFSTMKTFMWTEIIVISDFNKSHRLNKINKINNSTI